MSEISYKGEIIIYQTKDKKVQLEVKLAQDTVWLTQKQISRLFGVQRPAITKHLNNIFRSNELHEDSVCSILEHTAQDGNKRIAASIFLWFLEKNGILYREDGTKRIADNALVALTLMTAESSPGERGIIVTLTVNLINKNN